MFPLNIENLDTGVPFVMHTNGLAEYLNIDAPSVYPDGKNSVFVEETFGVWKVVASRNSDEVTEELLEVVRNEAGGVFVVARIELYCEDNDCDSCDSYDCDVKLVIIKRK